MGISDCSIFETIFFVLQVIQWENGLGGSGGSERIFFDFFA
jgi:hypothetical protein